MPTVKKERPLYKRVAIDIAGFGLMIIAPLIGWLPGPGGIPLFLIGLGLVATNHVWAENLLKNFDRYRTYFTDKYLMTNPVISRIIDVICLIAFVGGGYLSFTQTELLLRGLGLGLMSVSLLLLFSNQKRFERMVKAFKKRKQ